MEKIEVLEKIRLFAEEINGASGIDMWCFDTTLTRLFFSTSRYENDILLFLKKSSFFNQPLGSKSQLPFLLTDDNDFLWVAEDYYDQGSAELTFLLGPILINKVKNDSLIKRLNRVNLSFTQRKMIEVAIENIPILSLSAIYQYGIMLHYTLTHKRIEPRDFLYLTRESLSILEETNTEKNYENLYLRENILLQAIQDGNTSLDVILEGTQSLGSDFITDTGDSLRDAKNTVLVMCVLAARAAIKGGLSINAIKLSESEYLNRIEACLNISELIALNKEILKDFMERVRYSKQKKLSLPWIQRVIDDIHVHIFSDCTVKAVAKRIGYTEYYLTRKFQEITGEKMIDFIKNEKIRQAKILLSTTHMSIDEISDKLHFANRNHFTAVFKKMVGQPPGSFRQKNQEE